MANKPTEGAERPGRLKQIRLAAQMLHQADPKALPIVFAAGLGTLAVFVVVGLLIGQAPFLIPLGVLVAILVGMIIFGQLAQRAQYKMISGQLGAAASVLENMR